ncbi:MAG: helix-turn-helix transcriptional regulator [Flavobacterium sp.]|nr:helix-turn-helix transcriptional regulator [Flavobacterium sp.]
MENDEIAFIKLIGKKIRQKRIEQKLSQEILSFDADIPRNQIGRIERGEINTSLGTLYKICKALKIEVKDIIL